LPDFFVVGCLTKLRRCCNIGLLWQNHLVHARQRLVLFRGAIAMSKTTSRDEGGGSFPGWYVKFQAAVLEQMPRPGQLDFDTAKGWLTGQSELKAVLAVALLSFRTQMATPSAKLLVASEARQIMDRNIFDAADWMSYYDVKFTKKQIRDVGKFPWSEDVLNGPCPFHAGKMVRETHFAFLGVTRINGEPLTVNKWMELHPVTGQPRFYFASDPWHAGQPYADEVTMELRWYLLLKSIVPGSTDKTSEQQVAMLPEEYEVPSTIAEVTKDILVFRKTNVRPNPVQWAACKERTIKTSKIDKGLVSCVGYFSEYGLHVDCWNGTSHYAVGVGASRKFK
jgi:hypothetical protein